MAAHLAACSTSSHVPSLAGTCVQLDQPGEIDRECPAQEPVGGGVRMAGCCSDEGHCGSLETALGLGCVYAIGVKGRRCTPDSDPAPPDPDADGGA